MNKKIIIGRKDIVDFPKLELENIPVKIDTGAYTSSIHCHHIEEIIHDGEKVIHFQLLDPEHAGYNNQTFLVTNYSRKKIKSSNGIMEERFIIFSEIKIFEKLYPIELSLNERGSMRYPVLLGRKLLNKRFIVDTTKANLSYKQKNK